MSSGRELPRSGYHPFDLLVILVGEHQVCRAPAASPAKTHAPADIRHHDHAVPHRGEAGGDCLDHAVPEDAHGRDRNDTDDDPEHSEARPEHVEPDVPFRDLPEYGAHGSILPSTIWMVRLV